MTVEIYRSKYPIHYRTHSPSAYLTSLLFNAFRGYVMSVGPNDQNCGKMYDILTHGKIRLNAIQSNFDIFIEMVLKGIINDKYSRFLLTDAMTVTVDGILFSIGVINRADEVSAQIMDRLKH